MHTNPFIYSHQTTALHGYLAKPSGDSPKPAVLVVHDWSGRNAFACEKADALAALGYVGFAVDMFGEGRVGQSVEEKQALIEPFVSDRGLLASRMLEAFHCVSNMEAVDSQRIAVIGFCFGGLCALDLARQGIALSGAVSFHGLLGKPEKLQAKPIQARILALHGYEDPMVPPEAMNAFCEEMTEKQADWQVHLYGHTQHAFTNPQAHDRQLGTIYEPKAAARSWLAMCHFLQEIFSHD